MKKLLNLFKWIDNHILKILIIFFIFFIPLYPKLPLIDIEYTYVYIRIEDLFIVLISIIFFIQLIRRKATLNKQFLLPILLFWLAVLISFLYGFYHLKTIPVSFIGYYHAIRRIEYMIIFFIAFSTVKSKKDFYHFIISLLIVIFLASLYGIGQKLFGWPAVQTMNPEYAKGYLLYLTPEARISSTFAGHYDFASYLVFFIPFILGFYLLRNQFRYFIVFFFSLVALVFTASRVSYISYIFSTFCFLIFLRKYRLLIVIFLLTLGLTLLSSNLTSRLSRTFQVKRILVDQKTGAVYIPQKITTKELPAGSFYIKLRNQNAATSDAAIKEQILKQQKIKGKLSEKAIATLSANLMTVNTVVSDISFATRLQVEWPRAWNAFKSSIILGTGPSSITEATDNDYLRWLGEFGLLGTTIFFIILSMILITVFKTTRIYDQKSNYLLWGFIFGFAGLMINASYIDVFEASKIAYIFWLVSGIFVGLSQLKIKKI